MIQRTLFIEIQPTRKLTNQFKIIILKNLFNDPPNPTSRGWVGGGNLKILIRTLQFLLHIWILDKNENKFYFKCYIVKSECLQKRVHPFSEIFFHPFSEFCQKILSRMIFEIIPKLYNLLFCQYYIPFLHFLIFVRYV